jgi:hypothetical protein
VQYNQDEILDDDSSDYEEENLEINEIAENMAPEPRRKLSS